MKELSSLTTDKVLTSKVYRGQPSVDGISVILLDGDKDINQLMLDKGFAERKLYKQVCL